MTKRSITKDWCVAMVEQEGTSEVAAGVAARDPVSKWANDRGPVNMEQRLIVERDVLRFYLREIRHAVRLTRPENGRSKLTMAECLDWIDTMASAALQGAPFPPKLDNWVQKD